MTTELFQYVQGWSLSEPARVQTLVQNEAESRFDWWVEHIKQAGAEVSPVKRSMYPIKDDEGKEIMMSYLQRVKVTGSDDVIAQLKQWFKTV